MFCYFFLKKQQNLLLEIQSIDQNSNLSQWSKTEIRHGNLNIIKVKIYMFLSFCVMI